MKERYYSLDVFRGATVALMILVNNPGSWAHIFPPLEHATWHGCTPTDVVFPFFLFAVGNALAFVMPSLIAMGNTFFWKKIIKRTVLVFLIGLFINWYPFVRWHADANANTEFLIWKGWSWTTGATLHGIRIFGVLQRIAVAYFFAAIIVRFTTKKIAALISIGILLLYWALCYMLGDATAPYSLLGYFGTNIDKAVLGTQHLYGGEGVPFDPEGIISTLPAIVSVVIGFFVGSFIQQKGKTYEMLSTLFLYGVMMLFVGYCWDVTFPINKKLWTSSYVLFTGGLGILTIATVIYFVEFKNKRGAWNKFFDVFGKNPLFIFALSGLLVKTSATLLRIQRPPDGIEKNRYTTPLHWFYETVCKNIATDLRIGSLLYAFCFIALCWFIAYLLDKKKLYIKV